MAGPHEMKLTRPWRHGGVDYAPGDRIRVPHYVRERMLADGAASNVYGRSKDAAPVDQPAAQVEHGDSDTSSETSASDEPEEPEPSSSLSATAFLEVGRE